MDADTFLWLVLPLLAVAAGAIYQARRDRGDIQDLKGQPTAAAQVRRVRGSSVAGHRQGYDIARLTHPYARHGERETFAVIAGSFYQHHEKYRGPTDGYERHGIVVTSSTAKGKGIQCSCRCAA